jgi:lipopolysaccharide transport system permease protein
VGFSTAAGGRREDASHDARLDLPWVENRAPAGWLSAPSLRELWSFRELAYFLALRDLKVRYKQTAFGVAWVVLQPLGAAAIFTVIFGRLAQLPSDGAPYAVFAFAGMTLWTYFSRSLDAAAQSLVQSRDVVTKIAFPRILAPAAAVVPGLVDLAIALGVLAVFLVVYDVPQSAALLTLPLWVAGTLLVALGVGVGLAALNVRYRDVRHTLPFLLQIWLFASPVAYSASLVEGGWRYVYALNPLAGLVEGFRWSVGAGPTPGPELLVSAAAAAVLIAAGTLYFLRAERTFADVI